ncbi:MAG: type II toxin-antitoxin system RelE/ParE family toxin [Rickettsiales bacterium]|jgi:mRNA-degrading endonuclease RelE of RelBE toxin-antitoxin system|nr:type II toxin-antitoxin system RelE/ParE family toxin [Rickettsiales bacterium]
MQLTQTSSFNKIYKKLHSNQLPAVNAAIKFICDNPEAGELKRGDLDWLRVYKFKINAQLVLLGYCVSGDDEIILTLAALGSHENFYRDIKRT